MTQRFIQFIACVAAIAAAVSIQRSLDRGSTDVRLLEVRVSAMERHLAAIQASAQQTSQHLRVIKEALPTQRWPLQPGIPGLTVEVPIFVERLPHNPVEVR